jgi:ribosomal-protein-alanine N-acetyltransferase
MHIETERLILRPFAPEDLDDLAAIRAKPEVMKYIGNGQPQTREQAARRLRTYIEHYESHGFSMCAALWKTDGRLIGLCGLFSLDRTPEIEVGYTFDQPFWGLGLATEAAHAWLRYGFEELRLKAIAAIAYPENTASRHVMEKLGMKYRRNGRFYDMNCVYYRIERDAFRPLPLAYQLHNEQAAGGRQ